ncbi:unnamed protein product, partial [marine sediment metagenome]
AGIKTIFMKQFFLVEILTTKEVIEQRCQF